MPNNRIKELESAVTKLESERQAHLDAISEIEDAFAAMGIRPGAKVGRRRKPGPKPGRKRGRKPGPKPGRRRGRKPGPKPGRKRGRKPGPKAKKKPGPKPGGKRARKGKGPTGNRYAVSGTDLVLRMVKQAGAKGIAGGKINAVWVKQGRAGTAYNILGVLGKEGKVKRQKLKGQRGSVYVAA